MQKSMTGAALVLLAGCVSQAPPKLGEGLPSTAFARTALSDGAPQVAYNVSEGILKARPEDTQALIVQGDALAQLDRRPEAAAVYRRVISQDPGSVAANMGLGRLLLATDATGAEALFAKALGRQPDDAAALNDIGIARDLQGRHADAQVAYRQAMAAAPGMAAATTNLALSLSLSGHAVEAMQLLRPLAEAPNPQPRLRYDIAAVATMAGERQSAADLLKNDLTSDKLQNALDGFAALSPAQP
jgi:Flp pilus assembly protein TadD